MEFKINRHTKTLEEPVMQTFTSKSKQHGFFDLGIGLGLLLVFGGTAAVVTPDETQTPAVAEVEQQETVTAKSEVDNSKSLYND